MMITWAECTEDAYPRGWLWVGAAGQFEFVIAEFLLDARVQLITWRVRNGDAVGRPEMTLCNGIETAKRVAQAYVDQIQG